MPTPEIVQLRPETIEWATWEGGELRLKNYGDTREKKIENSIFGSYAQQLFVDRTNGHRVTKEEVPGFEYDVTCDNDVFRDYTGYQKPVRGLARVELKAIRMDHRNGKWVSLYESFMKYAMKCGANDLYDYLVVYGVDDIDDTTRTAKLNLMAAVSSEVFKRENIRNCFPRSTFWNDAEWSTQTRYFIRGNVHADGLGKIFV